MNFKRIYVQKHFECRSSLQLWNWINTKDDVSVISTRNMDYTQEQISESLFLGSVPWVEQVLGINPIPDYFPNWLSGYFKPVYIADSSDKIESYPCFLKPADCYKRFNSKIFYSKQQVDDYCRGPFVVSPAYEGPFIAEWRYYIANGEVYAAEWYKGLDDKEVGPPKFIADILKGYCGVIDLGIPYYVNRVVLIEAHHPYSCGWYGYQDKLDRFLEWAWEGQKHMLAGNYKDRKSLDI